MFYVFKVHKIWFCVSAAIKKNCCKILVIHTSVILYTMEIEIILWKTIWYCLCELLSSEHHAVNCLLLILFFLMNHWILKEPLHWLFCELLSVLWYSELLSSEHHPTNTFFLINYWTLWTSVLFVVNICTDFFVNFCIFCELVNYYTEYICELLSSEHHAAN